jgi:TetR/AcrR family transcriptional regulator, repressor for neighboring sulfatase
MRAKVAKRQKLRAKRRVRRDPAEARALILEAAERVLAVRGPDAVGLKDVARAAGVSHALVTHYFGTYDKLVEATMEAFADRARLRLLELLGGQERIGPETLVDTFFELIDDPRHGRLVAWAMLSGRSARADFFARRMQGPKQIVDAIEGRLRDVGAAFEREEIEFLVLLVMTACFGYAMGKATLWEAMGREPGPERDRAFRRRLGEVVRERATARLLGGKTPP